MTLQRKIIQPDDEASFARLARCFEVSEVYDVDTHKSLLVLQKHMSYVVIETLLTTGLAIVWLYATGIYGNGELPNILGDAEHLVPALAFGAAGLSAVVWSWRELWQARRGDTWILDDKAGYIIHNGAIVAATKDVKFVRGWARSKGDSEEYRLEIVLRQGKPIFLGRAGSWEECSTVAKRIADYAHLPVKLK